MQTNDFDYGFPVRIIDDYFSQQELYSISKELDDLYDSEKLVYVSNKWSDDPQKVRSVGLDQLYEGKRTESTILNCTRKILSGGGVLLKSSSSWFFKDFECDRDRTILSSFRDGDCWGPHKDPSIITAVCFLYDSPKTFTGGELIFPDYEVGVEPFGNRIALFPSFINHEITPVKVDNGRGLITLTQYLSINEFVTEAKDTDVPNRVSIGGDAGTFKYNVPSDYTLAEGNAEASYK